LALVGGGGATIEKKKKKKKKSFRRPPGRVVSGVCQVPVRKSAPRRFQGVLSVGTSASQAPPFIEDADGGCPSVDSFCPVVPVRLHSHFAHSRRCGRSLVLSRRPLLRPRAACHVSPPSSWRFSLDHHLRRRVQGCPLLCASWARGGEWSIFDLIPCARARVAQSAHVLAFVSQTGPRGPPPLVP